MTLRKLHKRCRAIVEDFGLPDPFSLDVLRLQLEQQRGRPIHISLFPQQQVSSLGPCGLWIATSDVDFVFFEGNTTPLHRMHIIVHEMAHIMCGHEASDVHASVNVTSLLPGLDPSLVRHIFGRTSYATKEEEEAEMVASMILDHASRVFPLRLSEGLGRLELVLGANTLFTQRTVF